MSDKNALQHPSHNALFATLCASCVVLALLSTALNTALPAIAAGLGVKSQTTQWLVSGAGVALAFAGMAVVSVLVFAAAVGE